MKLVTTKFLAAMLLMLGLAACSKTGPEVFSGADLSDKASLEKLSFLAAGTEASAILCNGYYCVTVPEGTDRAALVPAISVSRGASVTVDGQSYEAGKAFDFSTDVQTIKVVSESGRRSSTYKVLVKNGDLDIDRQVYKFMSDFKVPGVSVSIMKGSTIVYSYGYGLADKAAETRVTPDHLFRMASISKQFCALCIMRLVEQGRLQLDQTVFGEKGILKGIYGYVTPYHEAITVRHLLSHSSGITKGLTDPAFNWSYRMFEGTSTPVPTDTLIQRTLKARPQPYDDGSQVWGPGVAFSYSNVGYCILHRVVEVVSGKDYESFLKEDVLEPMGIADTHIGGYLSERRPNECVYYSQDGADGYSNCLLQLAGAAGIITSTNQLMKLLTYIDGDDEVPDLFSHETLEEMYTPYQYSGSGTYGSSYHRYGLGWRMNHSVLFGGAHYHGGDIAGTATLWAGRTYTGMSGAFVCNSRAYNSNSTGSMDDNLYVLLDKFMKHFE
jgi:CubicO group peptidase (beta-lactamase class C family)